MKKILYYLPTLVPSIVFAQQVVITNPITSPDIMTLITTIMRNVVMPIAAVLVVLYIIYAGFTFVTAQGNPKKIQDAQQRLLWSLIGAGILLGATAISAVVCRTVSSITNNPVCGA